MRAEAERANSAAAALNHQAARILADHHLTVRDIGAIMGISYQRAHQLVS